MTVTTDLKGMVAQVSKLEKDNARLGKAVERLTAKLDKLAAKTATTKVAAKAAPKAKAEPVAKRGRKAAAPKAEAKPVAKRGRKAAAPKAEAKVAKPVAKKAAPKKETKKVTTDAFELI